MADAKPANLNFTMQDLDGKNVCTIPPGGDCDLEAENSYCQAPTICGPDEAGKGYCGLPPGATCDPAVEKQCARVGCEY